MSTENPRATGPAQQRPEAVDPAVWRAPEQGAPHLAVARAAQAKAQAQASEQLPWQQAKTQRRPWSAGSAARASESPRQTLSEAARVILGQTQVQTEDQTEALAQAPTQIQAQKPQAAQEQAQDPIPEQAQQAGTAVKPRPSLLFQRKHPQHQAQAQAEPKPAAESSKTGAGSASRSGASGIPDGHAARQDQVQKQAPSPRQTSALGEIGSGARHLLTGAGQILCGALHGVTATGRYTLDGVLAGSRATLAAGRYSLLGVGYALTDSTQLVRGAVAWVCPEPKHKAEKC